VPYTSWPGLILAFLVFALCQPSRAQTPTFGSAVALGNLNTFDVWEASGLIASRQNPGVLWSHNDSGYPGTVFAFFTNGTLLARWTVPGVFSGDFEDIAVGPGPSPSYQYIYLGDIGDNFLARTSIRILRFPEPGVDHFHSDAPPQGYVPRWEEITLSYPAGDGPYNCEGMFVDPWTGDLFLFTKLDTTSRVFRATRSQFDSGEPVTLQFALEIPFRRVSAADISPDGSMILVRRGAAVSLWTRAPGQSVEGALAGSSTSLGIATEPNGESIAFAANNDGFYTLSEGYQEPIYLYPRTDATPPAPRVLVPPESEWTFDDLGFGDSLGWTTVAFDDDFWLKGAAPLGYGGTERTTLSYGVEADKVITTYLRHKFVVTNAASFSNLALRVAYNDGLAAYLNGTEILRENLAPGAAWDTLAEVRRSDLRQFWKSWPVNPAPLVNGTNVLAVELHRGDRDGMFLHFDLQLIEAQVASPARFITFPRLINGQCSIRVRGPAGSTARVESTIDFTSWTTAGRVLLSEAGPEGTGEGEFQEPLNSPLKFYRIAD
jgi:hypothetical protein